ncbi:hypothetical protein AMECASPLE_012678 [Ameca splendens]|uniref:Secreted protein n=1 Tax=Ameca splendens TaxID=208324 RepID=A0ABV0YC12_9TELE
MQKFANPFTCAMPHIYLLVYCALFMPSCPRLFVTPSLFTTVCYAKSVHVFNCCHVKPIHVHACNCFHLPACKFLFVFIHEIISSHLLLLHVFDSFLVSPYFNFDSVYL